MFAKSRCWEHLPRIYWEVYHPDVSPAFVYINMQRGGEARGSKSSRREHIWTYICYLNDGLRLVVWGSISKKKGENIQCQNRGETLKKKKASLIVIPFCHREAVVCVVEAGRWGVVDVCDLRPGAALQQNTWLHCGTFLPVVSCSLTFIYPPSVRVSWLCQKLNNQYVLFLLLF